MRRDASTPPMISHYLDPNHHQEHETLDLVSIKPTDSVHIPNVSLLCHRDSPPPSILLPPPRVLLGTGEPAGEGGRRRSC